MKTYIFAYVVFALTCFEATEADTWVKEMEAGKFEGDMVLSAEQRNAIITGTSTYGSMIGGRWPGRVVPYEFTSTVAPGMRYTIKKAIEQYHKHTCITFRPKRKGDDEEYVRFQAGNGCSANVGWRHRFHVTVTLHDPGCKTVGIVMHELGHAIGLYHEQARPDRDQYIEILRDNIADDMLYNFDMHQDINSLGTKYDYNSMMHYGPYAFGKKWGLVTIRTKDGSRIGNRKGFSKTDIEQIKIMYNCSGDPPTHPPTLPPDTATCYDVRKNCYIYPKDYCIKYKGFMSANCMKTCNKCIRVSTPIPSKKGASTTIPLTTNTQPTTKGAFTTTPLTTNTKPLPKDCKDLTSNCPYFVKHKYCELRRGNMKIYCKRSCNLC